MLDVPRVSSSDSVAITAQAISNSAVGLLHLAVHLLRQHVQLIAGNITGHEAVQPSSRACETPLTFDEKGQTFSRRDRALAGTTSRDERDGIR